MLTIKELAKLTETSTETIRYYEKIGIIPKPKRLENGYRSYDKAYIIKIKFIIKAKKLGFTLQEIKQLFSNALDPEATCNDIADIALAKIEQIDQQIYELNKMKELLNSVSIKCEPSYSIQECPIINSLMENTEN
jgi:MerR family mercuric resistance operon transcriptional regulator